MMIEGILKASSVIVPLIGEEERGSNCFEINGALFSVVLDEEALYSLELSLLSVMSDNGTDVLLGDLWSLFCLKCSHFPIKYAVYKYFRERCFVVRSGVNFGMDYALYRKLPSQCHSEFCVRVIDARNSTNNINWRELSSLTRVMPDVMKICLICYVFPKATNPPETSEASITTTSKYEHLFSNSSTADIAPPSISTEWIVNPVSVMIRRLPVNGTKYLNIDRIHQKYRHHASKSPMNNNRATAGDSRPAGSAKQKNLKRRRNITEVRAKTTTKTNSVWEQLQDEPSHPTMSS